MSRIFLKKARTQKGQAFALSIAVVCISAPTNAAEKFQPGAKSSNAQKFLTQNPIEPLIGDVATQQEIELPEATEHRIQGAAPAQEETSSAESLSEQAPDVVPEAAPRAIAYARPITSELLVVDNDVEKTKDCAPKANNTQQEITNKPGDAHIASGVRIPVVSISSLSSRTARVGDRMEARLKADLIINGRIIAPKGTLVVGHVSSAYKARRLLVAEVSLKRNLRANGALGITFDAIITGEGAPMPLVAKPARQARIVKNKNEGRELGVNHNGEIAAPLSTQLKHQGEHLVIRGAAAVGGVFTMGAVPVVFGVLGAISPSFAYMQPVGQNVPHRRLKGFGMGVISGMPGGFVVADFLIRGVEAQVKPGDEFLVELQQHFTGEANTSAELLPVKTKNVHAEVLNKKNSRK